MNKMLFIIRHGEAIASSSSDFNRTLTVYGKKQVSDLAVRLAQRIADLQVEHPGSGLFLVSPYVRAQQTAKIMGEKIHFPQQTFAAITPDDPVDVALNLMQAELNSAPSYLILVSHMPFVGDLFSMMTEGRVGVGRGFVTAECVQLACSEYLPGCGIDKGIV